MGTPPSRVFGRPRTASGMTTGSLVWVWTLAFTVCGALSAAPATNKALELNVALRQDAVRGTRACFELPKLEPGEYEVRISHSAVTPANFRLRLLKECAGTTNRALLDTTQLGFRVYDPSTQPGAVLVDIEPPATVPLYPALLKHPIGYRILLEDKVFGVQRTVLQVIWPTGVLVLVAFAVFGYNIRKVPFLRGLFVPLKPGEPSSSIPEPKVAAKSKEPKVAAFEQRAKSKAKIAEKEK